MAAAPKFKVYSSEGEYVAACKYVEEAAAIVAMRGEGWTIRAGHRYIVWHEGHEADEAGNSYDFVAETVWGRIKFITNL
jgi:hypothetical protein